MAKVYLGLGSNLGDRLENIQRSLTELKSKGIAIIKMSTIIETDPVGGPAQGKYLNAVAECVTTQTPEELLAAIGIIEWEMGRIRTVKDGPRVIDIDILLYDELTINLPNLIIPHPRMRSRAFVLEPLKEIAPHLFEQKIL